MLNWSWVELIWSNPGFHRTSHQHVMVSSPFVCCVGEGQRKVVHPPLVHLLQGENQLISLATYLIFLSFEVDDLVVGEEPGKGGEGSHHPLEGDHCLFHVAVQKEDRSSRETVRKNFHSMLIFFKLLQYI